MELNRITGKIVSSAIEVHKILGPGLLESSYHNCLKYELIKSGFYVESELYLPIKYKEIKLEKAYRIDLLINNSVVVEVKAVDAINEVHIAQALTYMKFSEISLGLILNFNTKLMTNGIKRLIQ